MRSDSEVLTQIASDVAEIKAAVNKGQSCHAESEPCRADLTPEAARGVVERWRKEREFRADLPPRRLRDVWAAWEERHCGLTDFRGDLYRGTFSNGARDQWRPMTQLGGFKDPYFRPHGTTWTHVERLAQEREAQERLLGTCMNYRYSDVVLRASLLTSISHESEAFTIATTRLKPLMAFKPERLALSESWFAIYRDRSTSPTVVQLGAEDLTIMRIRVGDKDVVVEPMSAWGHQFGGFSWPAVHADSEVEITLAVSKTVLDRVTVPLRLAESDPPGFSAVWVTIGLSLAGSKLR